MSTAEVADATPVPSTTGSSAYRPQSVALLVSATRCLLTYVVGPLLLPATGALLVPGLGVGASILAIVLDVRVVRRLRRQHDQRSRRLAAFYVALIAFVTALLIVDLVRIAR
jgi:hypothetical protein